MRTERQAVPLHAGEVVRFEHIVQSLLLLVPMQIHHADQYHIRQVFSGPKHGTDDFVRPR
jgi:hypothetical protein